MKLNRIFLFALSLWLSAGTAFAQKDRQAQKVLDQTVATLQQGGGICLTFAGSSEGTLQLKGDCFYLNSNGIQSWFDGKTQWTYVTDSEEVNITHPSSDELQTLHPMALLAHYKQGYNYQYNGTRIYNGQTAHVLTLNPEKSNSRNPTAGIKQINVFISSRHLPLYIKVETTQGHTQEFKVISCQLHQPLDKTTFTFDHKQFPNVEIIDLR